MKSYLSAVLACASIGILTVVGCASGGNADEAALAALPAPSADTGKGTDSTPIPPSSGPDDADGGVSTRPPPKKTDAGTSPDGGHPSSSSSSGGPDPCASSNACASATDLGSVRGDEGSDVQTASGTTSQWLSILVKEVSGAAVDPSLKATLTSPAGANFDLFLYADTSLSCGNAPSKSSTSTSGTDSALVSNGDWPGNDDFYVIVEVRHVSGTCAAGSSWSLTLEGNQ